MLFSLIVLVAAVSALPASQQQMSAFGSQQQQTGMPRIEEKSYMPKAKTELLNFKPNELTVAKVERGDVSEDSVLLHAKPFNVVERFNYPMELGSEPTLEETGEIEALKGGETWYVPEETEETGDVEEFKGGHGWFVPIRRGNRIVLHRTLPNSAWLQT